MAATSDTTYDLFSALGSFAATEVEIVRTGAMAGPNLAASLLQLRRQFVDDFAHVSAALESEPKLVADPELMSQAMRVLSAFRARNSINQADWPVIRVRDNPAEYQQAIGHVIEASNAFWHLIETELGFRK